MLHTNSNNVNAIDSTNSHFDDDDSDKDRFCQSNNQNSKTKYSNITPEQVKAVLRQFAVSQVFRIG